MRIVQFDLFAKFKSILDFPVLVGGDHAGYHLGVAHDFIQGTNLLEELLCHSIQEDCRLFFDEQRSVNIVQYGGREGKQ